MSWLYGKLFLREQNEGLKEYRPHLYSLNYPKLVLRAGGSGKNLINFKNPNNTHEEVYILGQPILRKGDDYSYPDKKDWALLLKSEEELYTLDGHWVIVIAAKDELRVYNDALGNRSFYVYEDSDGYFFASDTALLKEAGRARLDIDKFGVFWHSVFPPNKRRYTPAEYSPYEKVSRLFQGGMLKLSPQGLLIQSRLITPAKTQRNLALRLENITLLPLRAGKSLCLGLTGGMDIRPLLAILLRSGIPFTTVHFGKKDDQDYQIAKALAKDFGLSFRFIPYEKSGQSWQQTKDYLFERGFGYNPASNDLHAYLKLIGEESEVFIGGYFGELYRMRFMAAHLKSLLKPKAVGCQDFYAYLYQSQDSFFIPEVNLKLHQGFRAALKEALAKLPEKGGMNNAMWMNLIYARYAPASITSADLSASDMYVQDLMPYMQPSLIRQHWQYPLYYQLNEGLHRGIIKDKYPALQRYPLALGDTKAPYYYRPYLLKLKDLHLGKRNQKQGKSRIESFLHNYENEIRDLALDSKTRQDGWINLPKLNKMVAAYYQNGSYQNELMSFISYALGK